MLFALKLNTEMDSFMVVTYMEVQNNKILLFISRDWVTIALLRYLIILIFFSASIYDNISCGS